MECADPGLAIRVAILRVDPALELARGVGEGQEQDLAGLELILADQMEIHPDRAADNMYDADLRRIADAHSWEYRPGLALNAARGLYFSMPAGTKLWFRGKELVDLVPDQVRALLRD